MSRKWIITLEITDDDACGLHTAKQIEEDLEVHLPSSDDFTVTIKNVRREQGGPQHG